MRYEGNHMRLGLLIAAVLAAAVGGCGNDNGFGPKEEIALATFGTGSSGGISSPGTLATPVTIEVQFGLHSPPPDPNQYPIPLAFGTKAISKQGQTIFCPVIGSDARVVANRLTDGVDEGFLYWVLIGGQRTFGFLGTESSGFTYASGLTRTGPDLEGYVVTRIEFTLDTFTVSQDSSGWAIEVSVTGTIYGYKS